jgi:glucose-1-phosphate cytidylyltransferase
MDPVSVVILCGGKGTRSYPFTQHFPKVMMPINGTPILVHLMRIYAAQGFHHFVLSVGYRKEILIDYFDGRSLDWKIDIVDTGEEGETGDRVRRCSDYVGSTFFATYGDGLGNVDLHALLDHHRDFGGLATLTTVPLYSQYGVVKFDEQGTVERFVEKPTIPDYWINAGFFVFQKQAFDHWQGHNLEGDVLPALAARQELTAYRHRGFWKSMDTSKDATELENLMEGGNPPWVMQAARAAGAAA